MKKLVILGSGTGGTIMATKMRQKLPESQWEITIIDQDWQHHYQPGWIFIPFGIYTKEDCVKPKTKFIPKGVNFVLDEILGVDPVKKEVKTKRDAYAYDWLIVATGCRIMPTEVEGMMEDWGKNIHNFYSLDGAMALSPAPKARQALSFAVSPRVRRARPARRKRVARGKRRTRGSPCTRPLKTRRSSCWSFWKMADRDRTMPRR